MRISLQDFENEFLVERTHWADYAHEINRNESSIDWRVMTDALASVTRAKFTAKLCSCKIVTDDCISEFGTLIATAHEMRTPIHS